MVRSMLVLSVLGKNGRKITKMRKDMLNSKFLLQVVLYILSAFSIIGSRFSYRKDNPIALSILEALVYPRIDDCLAWLLSKIESIISKLIISKLKLIPIPSRIERRKKLSQRRKLKIARRQLKYRRKHLRCSLRRNSRSKR
jgi:hypothetical protein